jgi:hypothetical protein
LFVYAELILTVTDQRTYAKIYSGSKHYDVEMPKYIVAASIMILKCRYTLPEYYTLLYGNIIDYAYILDEWKSEYYYIPCVRMLYVYILEYLRPNRNCAVYKILPNLFNNL